MSICPNSMPSVSSIGKWSSLSSVGELQLEFLQAVPEGRPFDLTGSVHMSFCGTMAGYLAVRSLIPNIPCRAPESDHGERASCSGISISTTIMVFCKMRG